MQKQLFFVASFITLICVQFSTLQAQTDSLEQGPYARIVWIEPAEIAPPSALLGASYVPASVVTAEPNPIFETVPVKSNEIDFHQVSSIPVSQYVSPPTMPMIPVSTVGQPVCLSGG